MIFFLHVSHLRGSLKWKINFLLTFRELLWYSVSWNIRKAFFWEQIIIFLKVLGSWDFLILERRNSISWGIFFGVNFFYFLGFGWKVQISVSRNIRKTFLWEKFFQSDVFGKKYKECFRENLWGLRLKVALGSFIIYCWIECFADFYFLFLVTIFETSVSKSRDGIFKLLFVLIVPIKTFKISFSWWHTNDCDVRMRINGTFSSNCRNMKQIKEYFHLFVRRWARPFTTLEAWNPSVVLYFLPEIVIKFSII